MTATRKRLVLVLAVLVPVGVALKWCVPGAVGQWCSAYGAALAYEAFWMALVALVWPAVRPAACASAVFSVTCGLECLQLWRPPWLESIRRTFPGAVLLGNTFDPWDFPCYAAGCAIGFLLLRAAVKTCR